MDQEKKNRSVDVCEGLSSPYLRNSSYRLNSVKLSQCRKTGAVRLLPESIRPASSTFAPPKWDRNFNACRLEQFDFFASTIDKQMPIKPPSKTEEAKEEIRKRKYAQRKELFQTHTYKSVNPVQAKENAEANAVICFASVMKKFEKETQFTNCFLVEALNQCPPNLFKDEVLNKSIQHVIEEVKKVDQLIFALEKVFQRAIDRMIFLRNEVMFPIIAQDFVLVNLLEDFKYLSVGVMEAVFDYYIYSRRVIEQIVPDSGLVFVAKKFKLFSNNYLHECAEQLNKDPFKIEKVEEQESRKSIRIFKEISQASQTRRHSPSVVTSRMNNSPSIDESNKQFFQSFARKNKGLQKREMKSLLSVFSKQKSVIVQQKLPVEHSIPSPRSSKKPVEKKQPKLIEINSDIFDWREVNIPDRIQEMLSQLDKINHFDFFVRYQDSLFFYNVIYKGAKIIRAKFDLNFMQKCNKLKVIIKGEIVPNYFLSRMSSLQELDAIMEEKSFANGEKKSNALSNFCAQFLRIRISKLKPFFYHHIRNINEEKEAEAFFNPNFSVLNTIIRKCISPYFILFKSDDDNVYNGQFPSFIEAPMRDMSQESISNQGGSQELLKDIAALDPEATNQVTNSYKPQYKMFPRIKDEVFIWKKTNHVISTYINSRMKKKKTFVEPPKNVLSKSEEKLVRLLNLKNVENYEIEDHTRYSLNTTEIDTKQRPLLSSLKQHSTSPQKPSRKEPRFNVESDEVLDAHFKNICESSMGFAILDFEDGMMRIMHVSINNQIPLLMVIHFIIKMVRLTPPLKAYELILVKTSDHSFNNVNYQLKTHGFYVKSICFNGKCINYVYRALESSLRREELPGYFASNIHIVLPNEAPTLNMRVVVVSSNKYSGFVRVKESEGLFDASMLIFFALNKYEKFRVGIFDKLLRHQTSSLRARVARNEVKNVDIVTLETSESIFKKFKELGYASSFSSAHNNILTFSIAATFASMVHGIRLAHTYSVRIGDSTYIRITPNSNIMRFKGVSLNSTLYLIPTQTPGLYLYLATEKGLAADVALKQKNITRCVQELFDDLNSAAGEEAQDVIYIRKFEIDLVGIDMPDYLNSVEKGGQELKTVMLNLNVAFNQYPVDFGIRYELEETPVRFEQDFFFGLLLESLEDELPFPPISVFVCAKTAKFDDS